MTGKMITKEQIDALPYVICMNEPHVSVSDLCAMYDNAPSVVGEPLGYVVASKPEMLWGGTDTSILFRKYDGHLIPVYTTQQPDRVAKLEATIKSYNEFLASGTPEKYRAKIAELEAKLKEYEADAKRYQWLKCNAEKDSPKSMVLILGKNNSFEEPLSHFDEVIDKAMKGGE